MAIKRIIQENQDEASINSTQYNKQSGAQKQVDAGPNLKPLATAAGGTTTYTTDASTAKALSGLGKSIAVFNNSSSVAAVTLGIDNTITALAAGACDANGNVGIPCTPMLGPISLATTSNGFALPPQHFLVFEIVDDTTVQTVK